MNEKDAARVDELAHPHPIATMIEKLKLSGAYRSREDVSTCTAPCCRAKVRSSCSTIASLPKAGEAHALPCGHDVMLDLPDRVTEIRQGKVNYAGESKQKGRAMPGL